MTQYLRDNGETVTESLLTWNLTGAANQIAAASLKFYTPFKKVAGVRLKYLQYSAGVSASLVGEVLLLLRCGGMDVFGQGSHDYMVTSPTTGYPIDLLDVVGVDPTTGKVDNSSVEEHSFWFDAPRDLYGMELALQKSDGSSISIPAGQKLVIVLAIMNSTL